MSNNISREERVKNDVERALKREALLNETEVLLRKANNLAPDIQAREYSLSLRQLKWGAIAVAALTAIAVRQFLAIRQ
mgnify:CR=1 FL=1